MASTAVTAKATLRLITFWNIMTDSKVAKYGSRHTDSKLLLLRLAIARRESLAIRARSAKLESFTYMWCVAFAALGWGCFIICAAWRVLQTRSSLYTYGPLNMGWYGWGRGISKLKFVYDCLWMRAVSRKIVQVWQWSGWSFNMRSQISKNEEITWEYESKLVKGYVVWATRH